MSDFSAQLDAIGVPLWLLATLVAILIAALLRPAIGRWLDRIDERNNDNRFGD